RVLFFIARLLAPTGTELGNCRSPLRRGSGPGLTVCHAGDGEGDRRQKSYYRGQNNSKAARSPTVRSRRPRWLSTRTARALHRGGGPTPAAPRRFGCRRSGRSPHPLTRGRGPNIHRLGADFLRITEDVLEPAREPSPRGTTRFGPAARSSPTDG